MHELFRNDADHASRFGSLSRIVAADQRPALFVPRGPAAELVRVHQFDGGRDAKYLVVIQREVARRCKGPRATIGFLPEVPGTAIIYDLTDQTLQGKARPFDCDLTSRALRLYALLPVQIEEIAVFMSSGQAPKLKIEFRDATGKRLEAALPFRLQFHNRPRVGSKSTFGTTELNGQYVEQLRPGQGEIAVISTATGREQSIEYAHVTR
jgi:hypothetical protein